jgi:DNA-binding MarR family transcriptional regulator
MGDRKTRDQVLKDALREALLGVELPFDVKSSAPVSVIPTRERERRQRLAKSRREEDTEFVRAIEETAKLIRDARAPDGEPVYRTDIRYRVLAGIESGGGWPSMSGLGRVLRMSKQAARQQVIAAARMGLLELLPDPFDRRSMQIGLTPSGKNVLAAARAREHVASDLLIRGLGERGKRLVAHVLRVMRARLLRAEREYSRRQRQAAAPREPSR